MKFRFVCILWSIVISKINYSTVQIYVMQNKLKLKYTVKCIILCQYDYITYMNLKENVSMTVIKRLCAGTLIFSYSI